MLKRHLLRTKKRLTIVLVGVIVLIVALFPQVVLKIPEVQWHLFWPMVLLGLVLEPHDRLRRYVVVALGQVSDEDVVMSISHHDRVRLGAGTRWLAGLYGLRVEKGGGVLQLRQAANRLE